MNIFYNKSQFNSTLFIDLSKVKDNIRNLVKDSFPSQVIPVVKGNACGLGMVKNVMAILDAGVNDSIPCIAVTDVSEAMELKNSGINYPILVLGCLTNHMVDICIENNIIFNVGRLGIIEYIAKKLSSNNYNKVNVHLALDTGLHRNGIDVQNNEEFSSFINEIKKYQQYINIEGTYSHFIDTVGEHQEKTKKQYALFMNAIEKIKSSNINPGLVHLANSAASELFSASKLDAIRICRRLWFDNRDNPTNVVSEVATWKTSITNIKYIKSGSEFGYDNSMLAKKDMYVAIIGVGYGDGLAKELVAAKAPVLICGLKCPLLSVCMDCAFVDVSNLVNNLYESINSYTDLVGSEVTLYGKDSLGNILTAQEVASYINDEGCTLTTYLTNRVERIYID